MDKKKINKQEIMSLVETYFNDYHAKAEYSEGDKINYAARVYDEKEMKALVDSALEFWLTSGRYCDEFELKLAEFLSVKYCSLVNSGSSANLLAFMSLTSPLLKERAIRRGDEIITVAAGFPTTISPIIQYGAIPVFVDVTIPQYNIDITKLNKALTSKTKAIMIAHTLGNPFNLKEVKDFCNLHGLWLIEDNCDALGSRYKMNGEYRYTGTIGDIGTSSFYPPHHMTMGEGGAVYTNNALLHKILRSMRDWGRDCVCPSGVDNFCKSRFNRQFGKLPLGYDHKYVYSHFGYNLKATEMQAAVGVEQLKKLPDFIEKRKKNWEYLYSGLKNMNNLILPVAEKDSDPSWFGFLMTVKKPLIRDVLVKKLENANIQTRALFAGNITRHPCFDTLSEGIDYRIIENLNNTDIIMRDSFWIGVYPGMQKSMLDKMLDIIKN